MKPRFSCLVALLAACAAGTVSAAPVELKIATIVPDGTAWMASMREGASQISQRTEGRVKFKFYTGGVQGNDSQVRRKMRIGQLHGGVFTSGTLRQFQPQAELFGLPLLFRNYEEVAYVRERMDGELRQKLEDAGFVNFGIAGGGFAYLISNTPIATRADMRGVKVWIPEGDEIARRASAALGISSVTLPLTDVLTGLQTELIDTVMGPPVGVIVMQWHTAMKYITDVPIAYVYATMLIDAKAFNRISAADQAIVREVMEAVYRGFDEKGVAEDRAAYQALLDEGLEKVSIDAGEAAQWQATIDQANQLAAREGVVSAQMLTQLECYLAAFRAGSGDATCVQ
jgi:TRAP-type C4-dicarboxylate transport system substrate-binding protein